MLITLTGPNEFLRLAELEKLTSEFVLAYGEFSLEKVDGEEAEFQQIYDALTSLPFLASKKMVVLRAPSANKEFAERAESLLGSLPESTTLIIVEPKFDKRSSLYKLLKKTTDFREFGELDNNNLAEWLAEYAKNNEGNLSLADARFLVERAGTNQQLLTNELKKLLLYNPKITRETIELLTDRMPQSTIFELLDAAFAGNTKKAFALYEEQRALKVEPQQIIAMLAWQLHVLALIKTAGGRTPDQIAKEAKLNPFVVRKSSSIARKLCLPQFKKLVKDLLTLDVRLKTQSIDSDEALQYFLLTVSSSPDSRGN